jgi:hypothetical protein
MASRAPAPAGTTTRFLEEGGVGHSRALRRSSARLLDKRRTPIQDRADAGCVIDGEILPSGPFRWSVSQDIGRNPLHLA